MGRKKRDERRVFRNIFPFERKMPLSRRSYFQIQRAQLPAGSVQMKQNAAAVALEDGVAPSGSFPLLGYVESNITAPPETPDPRVCLHP